MNISEYLRERGLGSYERAVIEELSRVESATATEIVKETGVPQGRVYSVLNGLVGRGIVQLGPTRPKRYMIPNIRSALKRALEEEKEMIAKAEQQLERLQEKPRQSSAAHTVRIFSGRKEHFNALIDMRTTAQHSLRQIAPVFGGSAATRQSLINALKRGVEVKVITKTFTRKNHASVRLTTKAGGKVVELDEPHLLSLMIRDGEEFLIGLEDYTKEEQRVYIRGRNPSLLLAFDTIFEDAWLRAMAQTRQ